MFMYMMYGYGYGPEFAFMHVLNWIFWVALVILVVRLIRGKSWRCHGKCHDGWRAPWDNSALDILKERYAKGEINKEEFESKKKDLMS